MQLVWIPPRAWLRSPLSSWRTVSRLRWSFLSRFFMGLPFSKNQKFDLAAIRTATARITAQIIRRELGPAAGVDQGVGIELAGIELADGLAVEVELLVTLFHGLSSIRSVNGLGLPECRNLAALGALGHAAGPVDAAAGLDHLLRGQGAGVELADGLAVELELRFTLLHVFDPFPDSSWSPTSRCGEIRCGRHRRPTE